MEVPVTRVTGVPEWFPIFSAEAEQAEELYFTYLFNVSSADREAGDAFQKCLITHSP